jgi:hypothetical protein
VSESSWFVDLFEGDLPVPRYSWGNPIALIEAETEEAARAKAGRLYPEFESWRISLRPAPRTEDPG